MAASRSNKPFVAEEVVRIWRKLDPPGRFLVRTDPSLGDDSTWHDVGDKRARKKASQALREKERADDMLHQHHRQGAAATHPHAEATAGCTGHIPAMAAAPGVSLVSPMAVMPNNQQSNFAAAVTAMATAAAEAVHIISKLESGLGNFRFCVTAANTKPFIPFFPAAKSASSLLDTTAEGPPNENNSNKNNNGLVGFALGLENGKLAQHLLQKCKSMENISTIFRNGMVQALTPVQGMCILVCIYTAVFY